LWALIHNLFGRRAGDLIAREEVGRRTCAHGGLPTGPDPSHAAEMCCLCALCLTRHAQEILDGPRERVAAVRSLPRIEHLPLNQRLDVLLVELDADANFALSLAGAIAAHVFGAIACSVPGRTRVSRRLRRYAPRSWQVYRLCPRSSKTHVNPHIQTNSVFSCTRRSRIERPYENDSPPSLVIAAAVRFVHFS